ncbi:hypothetical protein QCD60_29110 [Pokkaliibacter sp. MBI-7]|uniref:hypothetical protein n=1 Tax=Pokkaliibacter sp. MBI-7 TaxID=3040600 RepID=UPI002446CAF6|nr:hypothetical protein [Pokkaliibacter sp. MBI-7]MDH2436576.1 hypothetical protein [Pokkaliibacter sp. MBI-7]
MSANVFARNAEVLLLLLLSLSAQAGEWQLYRQDRGVAVWYRGADDGRSMELRGELQVQAQPSALLAVLEDADSFSRWVAYGERVRYQPLIAPASQPQALSQLVHSYFNPPWPISNRDLLVQSLAGTDPDGRLWLQVQTSANRLPASADYLRIPDGQACWKAEPIPGTVMTRIRHQSRYTDIGLVPRVLQHLAARRALFSSLLRLQTLISAERYQQGRYGHYRLSPAELQYCQQLEKW